MPAVHIYESAPCCDTGVCGPDVDPSLLEVTADVRHLQSLGADIARHNLASDPTAFAADESVWGFLHTVGSKGLPLTMVDGVTVATGSYPNREQLLSFAGLAGPDGPAGEVAAPERTRPELGLSGKSGGCCGGSTSCC